MDMAARKKGNPDEDGIQGEEKKFSKEQILTAERFQKDRDLVNALLAPDRQYTVEAVEQMIEAYRKGKVR